MVFQSVGTWNCTLGDHHLDICQLENSWLVPNLLRHTSYGQLKFCFLYLVILIWQSYTPSLHHVVWKIGCYAYWCKLQMCKFLCIVQGGQVNNCQIVCTADLFHKCGAFAKCLPGRCDSVTTTCTWPSNVPNDAVCPHSSHLCVQYKP